MLTEYLHQHKSPYLVSPLVALSIAFVGAFCARLVFLSETGGVPGYFSHVFLILPIIILMVWVLWVHNMRLHEIGEHYHPSMERAFSSTVPSEENSYNSMNLAGMFARHGHRTIISQSQS